jgi:cobalt/nickel transport system permease protein
MRKLAPELESLETCAGRDTAIHRLHPSVKLAAAVVYVAAVISFGRRDVSGLMPYFFYPALLAPLSETPLRLLMRRVVPALPFALFGGMANLFFDSEPVMRIGGVAITGGVLSFVSIMIKTALSVSAVSLLVSATGMADLSRQLVSMRVPEAFVLQLVLTYRYLAVLAGESRAMCAAYVLRCPGARGIRIKDMGTFVGVLLLRSISRAERVYDAMKCRGFSGACPITPRDPPGARDILFLAVVCVAAIVPRCLN